MLYEKSYLKIIVKIISNQPVIITLCNFVTRKISRVVQYWNSDIHELFNFIPSIQKIFFSSDICDIVTTHIITSLHLLEKSSTEVNTCK